jgi:putative transposase
VVQVPTSGSGRISIAGLICTRPGHPPRLTYRTLVYHARKGEQKGFAEADYARLLDAAHAQLRGPIVLVWDNLSTHTSAAMQALVAARPWLTVYQLPTHAPELNPVEPVWAHLRKSLVNFLKQTLNQLTALVKSRLKCMQYRPSLLEGFIAKTGLDFAHPNLGP